MLPPGAAGMAGLIADAIDPTTPTGSPVAAIISASALGIASILTAIGTSALLRRRRQSEVDDVPAPLLSADNEDRPSRLRERLAVLETRAAGVDRRLTDLEERMDLHRAVDIVTEAAAAPRRRRAPRD